MKIGFIGQGWVGKHYADNFVLRGYEVIRYSLEFPFINNKELIKECDYTFICVPTPTTKNGFYDDIVRSVIPLAGKVVIIKSTLMPGTTEQLQHDFPSQIIMHSPEFLREKHAKDDVELPERNIIGITNPEHAEVASEVLRLMPPAPYQKVTTARNAEMVKYAGNGFLTMKVIFANLLYDMCATQSIDYKQVKDMLGADSRIGYSHLSPDVGGRGAGGNCFVKDFEGLKQFYERTGDTAGYYVLQSMIRYNNKLLFNSNKDLHILHAVYPLVVPKEEGNANDHRTAKSNQRSGRKGNARNKKSKNQKDNKLKQR